MLLSRKTLSVLPNRSILDEHSFSRNRIVSAGVRFHLSSKVANSNLPVYFLSIIHICFQNIVPFDLSYFLTSLLEYQNIKNNFYGKAQLTSFRSNFENRSELCCLVLARYSSLLAQGTIFVSVKNISLYPYDCLRDDAIGFRIIFHTSEVGKV